MSSTSLPGNSFLPDERKQQSGIGYLPHLLAKLDKDPESAAVLYEDLRRRLILFFRLRRPQEAEDLADTVLDRVARRLAEGTEIQKVEFYMVGVARFVLRERYAATKREKLAEEDLIYAQKTLAATPPEESAREASALALEKCLQGLASEERSMILTYYGADGPKRMRVRQDLSQQLRISLNALHNRALRLRKQLERCVEKRMATKGV